MQHRLRRKNELCPLEIPAKSGLLHNHSAHAKLVKREVTMSVFGGQHLLSVVAIPRRRREFPMMFCATSMKPLLNGGEVSRIQYGGWGESKSPNWRVMSSMLLPHSSSGCCFGAEVGSVVWVERSLE